MQSLLPVTELEVDELLKDWRWLCPEPMALLAVSAFGELLLQKPDGKVVLLDIHEGKLIPIAETVAGCETFLSDPKNAAEILKLDFVRKAKSRGLELRPGQCFTYKVPVVAAQEAPEICVMSIYEAVGFLGDVHRQIKDLPDGAKIRFEAK